MSARPHLRLHGFTHPSFARVPVVLGRQLRRTRVGGAAVAVWHRGEKVVDVWGGDRGPGGQPWEADTTAMSFSTTKGVASAALHVLAGRGLVDYGAPVAEYWPEFGCNGKERILVRHLLSHEAGLHAMRPWIRHSEEMLDWDHVVSSLAKSRPAYEPGTQNGYHAISYGWYVGEIVRRVSGKHLDEFVQDELVGPLGLDGMRIGTPPAERHRLARLTRTPLFMRMNRPLFRTERVDLLESLTPEGFGDFFWSDRVHDTAIPSANGTFTARSLAKLYAAIAGEGSLDGVRLFPEGTARSMGSVQNSRRDLVTRARMHWRLGFHGVLTGRRNSKTAFGHFGFGGSGAWADPPLDLAVAMTLNQVRGLDTRMISIGGAARQSALEVEGAPGTA